MLLDIIFIVIIILCVIWGVKRGIIRTVLGLSSFLVSIIAALFLYRPFMDMIYSNPAIASTIDGFKESIKTALLPVMQIDPALIETKEGIPAIFSSIIGSDIINKGTEAMALAVADAVVYLITIVVFILLIKLLVSLLFKIFNVAAKMPVIKQANKLVGGLLGLISGIFVCWILAAVLAMFIGQEGFGWIVNSVETSRFAKHLFTTNIIFTILR